MLENPKSLFSLIKEEMNGQTDNQQAKTVSGVDLGWVAGMVDGEGHIGFVRGGGPKRNQVQPRVIITGTNVNGLETLVDILTSAEMAHYVMWPHRPKSAKPYWSPKWTVTILGFKRVARFLQWVTPHLHIKKDLAETLLEFINYRQSRGNPKAPLGQIEEALLAKAAQINARPKP